MSDRLKNAIERVIIPTALVIALVIVSLWATRQSAMAEEYKNSATALYTNAFNELTDNLSNIEMTLGKLRVTTSPTQYVMLLDDVWRLSGASVSMMSAIPSYHLDTMELNKFIVRLGDYAHTLSKKAVQGKPITEEDMKSIDELHDACVQISTEFNERLDAGDIPVAIIEGDGFYSSENGDNGEAKGNESVSEFPTLIYDGPFSESVDKLEPKGLSGEEISEEEARSIASEIAGLGELEPQGASDGSIAAYDFHGTYDDGREVDVSISKVGGKLVWLMSSATGGAEGVPGDGAEAEKYKTAALEYLESQGFSNMRATYAQYYAGCALINFAATQNDVILYNDLVKVWIDRETLKPVGVDARNYLFSHVERSLETPSITMEEAEGMMSTSVSVQDRNLALIPITPETERLCYEFKGTFGEQEYIVYINAQTGEEEQIFMIVNTENGQLVI